LVIYDKDLFFGAKGLHAAGVEGDHDEAQRHTHGVGFAQAAAAAVALSL
jgi:hypothetical protein